MLRYHDWNGGGGEFIQELWSLFSMGDNGLPVLATWQKRQQYNTIQYSDKSSSIEYTKEQTKDRTSSAHWADTGLILSPLETQHITVVWWHNWLTAPEGVIMLTRMFYVVFMVFVSARRCLIKFWLENFKWFEDDYWGSTVWRELAPQFQLFIRLFMTMINNVLVPSTL